jgi:hypothetical protein
MIRELRILNMNHMAVFKQIALKPQDLLVALKLAVHQERQFTYAELASELFMSASEAHAAARRAEASRLISRAEGIGFVAIRSNVIEFIIHGVKYSFPAQTGALMRGVPTGFSGPALRSQFEQVDGLALVWPDPKGESRGTSLYPLYPSVPDACRIDTQLYFVLTLVDALRDGAAREREIAKQMLMEHLS